MGTAMLVWSESERFPHVCQKGKLARHLEKIEAEGREVSGVAVHSKDVAAYILHAQDKNASWIGVFRQGVWEEKYIPSAESKFTCVCGCKPHLLETVNVLDVSAESVRVKTTTARPEDVCAHYDEQWTFSVPSKPIRESESQRFVHRAEMAMYQMTAGGGGGSWHPPRVLKKRIDITRREARWLLFQHVSLEGIGLGWGRAQFRYSVWEMKGEEEAKELLAHTLTMRRIQDHPWAMFQRRGSAFMVCDDIFVVERVD